MRFVSHDASAAPAPPQGWVLSRPSEGGPWPPKPSPLPRPRAPYVWVPISLQLGFAERSRTWSSISSLFEKLSQGGMSGRPG